MKTAQPSKAAKKRRKPAEVEVSRMMLVICSVCGADLWYRPGEESAGDRLTAHYQAAGHAQDALTLPR